jgi:hypothetical protein
VAANGRSIRRRKLTSKKILSPNHRRSDMKKFLATLAMLTVIATPAFAQSFDAHVTRHKEGAAYNGNWGFAPGNGDDEWGRSRGFLDTNAPGCPLKFCD